MFDNSRTNHRFLRRHRNWINLWLCRNLTMATFEQTKYHRPINRRTNHPSSDEMFFDPRSQNRECVPEKKWAETKKSKFGRGWRVTDYYRTQVTFLREFLDSSKAPPTWLAYKVQKFRQFRQGINVMNSSSYEEAEDHEVDKLDVIKRPKGTGYGFQGSPSES